MLSDSPPLFLPPNNYAQQEYVMNKYMFKAGCFICCFEHVIVWRKWAK